MSRDDLLWRLAIALPVGLSLYAVASHSLLLAALPLPEALFPAALVLGLGVALWTTRPVHESTPSRASGHSGNEPSGRMWSLVDQLGPIALLLVLGTLIFGSVATSDRTWDGLVTWSPRAVQLRPPADLSAAFFTDRGVYAHSLNYPVLQPLSLGACQAILGSRLGRLFFPGLFLAMLVLVGATARAGGLGRRHTWIAVLAVGLTPMWFASGAGAVDSGYGELFLGFVLAISAAGLLIESPLLLVCGALCLPLVKPEGVLYGLLLCLVTLCATPGRRLHLAAVSGFAGALVLWMPLQARFLHESSSPVLIVAGMVLALLGGKETLDRFAPRTTSLATWAVGLALLVAFGVALIVAVVPETVTGSSRGLIGSFAADLPSRLADPAASLARVLDVLIGCVEGFLLVNKFGLLFPIIFGLLFLASTRRAVPNRALAGFFLGGVSIACTAMFLSPGDDLQHAFQSRFDRLLLQWTPVGWILLAPWVTTLLPAGPSTASEHGKILPRI